MAKMEVPPLGLNNLKAVEFECEDCGSMGGVNFEDQGIVCDVISPEIKIRLKLRPVGPEEDEVFVVEEIPIEERPKG